MSISWGTLGVQWGLPIFTVFVRGCRHTSVMLDENPEFTINVPAGDFEKKILGYCGRMSGRDTDKISDMNLTLVPGECVSVPAIKEFPLTLECRVVYSQLQDRRALPDEINERFYPQDVDSSNPSNNRDYHITYYGEIVNAYILEEEDI
jgi:flavin reductase (DIM6/NTAB) family NADH-FMN oxidoreductase RutF